MAAASRKPAAAASNNYSKNTQDLLGKLMGESKLTVYQQKMLRESMQSGGALPSVGPRPANYRREKAPSVSSRSGPWEDPYRGVALNPRLTQGMGRKPQQQIVSDANGYARDPFRGGGPMLDREMEKDKLADRFAFGSRDGPVAHPLPPATLAAPRRAPQPAAISEESALHEKISLEIEERQTFLAEMRALGQVEHEAAVSAEISQRLRDLKQLEGIMKRR